MPLNTRLAWLTAGLLLATGAFAADPCSAYKWDVSREVQLYTTSPLEATTSAASADAPTIEAGKLYALTLLPQESVHYPTPPSKRMLADGAFGGLLKFTVPSAGPHRIAIDSSFWLDVVHEGKALPAMDFNGNRECNGPRKIVVYDLPAGAELTLQIAAASTAAARLTITSVAATSP